MEQLALIYDNPLPAPGELFTYGTELYQMYDLLYHGGMTSAEAQKLSMTHTRRISDIREKLAPYGWTAVKHRIPGQKIFQYKLEKLETQQAAA
jgi:hypothetical protein